MPGPTEVGLSPGAKGPRYEFGTLLWTKSQAWRTTGWRDVVKQRPGLVLVPSPLLVAPCSSQLEYADDYEEYEVFRYRVDEVEWEQYANQRDGFAALTHLHPIDWDYVGIPAGALVPAACQRLRAAYADFVKRQSGDNG